MRRLLYLLFPLLAIAAPAPAIMSGNDGGDPFMNRRMAEKSLDRNALRAQVDETQAAVDLLARETRHLSRETHQALLKTLGTDFKLGNLEGRAGKAIQQAEAVLALQDAIAICRSRRSDASLPQEERLAEDAKLDELQAGLAGETEGLRDTLRSVHRNTGEEGGRDLRSWMMVSEGLLRQKREEAEPAPRAVSPAAEVISAEGITPTGEAVLVPTPTPTPTPAPTAGPGRRKRK